MTGIQTPFYGATALATEPNVVLRFVTNKLHRRNDHHGNTRRNETIFDGRCAAFIAQKIYEEIFHGFPHWIPRLARPL